jgi:hypothetical protein
VAIAARGYLRGILEASGVARSQLNCRSLTQFFGAFRALGATSTQPHNLRTRLLRDRRQISPGFVLASGCRRFR